MTCQRAAWYPYFDDANAILFLAPISCFDELLAEDRRVNRLEDSYQLWKVICSCKLLNKAQIILFLNKIDVFKSKLPKVPLEKYFPEYTGGPDINKAAKYILWRFMQANRARLSVYPHLTQATDTGNIRLVFAAVKETILQNALKDSGIL